MSCRSRPPPALWQGRRYAGRRIGLLGGSFNPAHDGHRHLSLVALRRLRLHEVWWLVSPQNPLKSGVDMAPLETRLAWARTRARHPRITVCNLEADLGVRYTARTLRGLRRHFRRTRFVWLMGADNLAQVHRWQDWTSIFRTTVIAVIDRPSYHYRALNSPAAKRYGGHRLPSAAAGRLAFVDPPRWCFLSGPLHSASASAIRAAAKTDSAAEMAEWR